MGEAQKPHFYDFGLLGLVPEPHNHLFLSLETQGDLKQIKKKPWNIKKITSLINIKTLEVG